MRIVFAGTPEFSVVALEALLAGGHQVVGVLTQPDRPAGRGQSLHASPVKQAALGADLHVLQPMTLRDASIAQAVSDLQPEVLVVVAYGLLLPQSFLTLAPLGAINIHASLLPRWRGAAPIQRALLAGDQSTGITLMQMEPGLDSGPIQSQQVLAIGAQETAGSLHDRLARLGADMVVHLLEAQRQGPWVGQTQPGEGITYAHKIRKGDAQIRWNDSAAMALRTVRAFAPAPSAQTYFKGEMLKVHAAIASARPASAPPGTIIALGDRIEVACSDHAIAITHLQRAGGRMQEVASLLRGFPMSVGDQFDSAPE